MTIETLDFGELLARYDRPQTFFYLDPPYYLRQVPYKHGMSVEDHERLARRLAGLKGKWLLSYNDVPEVRSLYKAHKISPVSFEYTIGSQPGKAAPVGRELLIRNY